ncbi:hypothetical protein ACPFP2_21210 [Micromonospora citrea]|uniref:hypothetical protein n=1 Tax=Micromonospora citrea TaxID=47855 RepID=UPI003C5CC4B5
MERFLRFEHAERDGVHTYVARVGEQDMPEPLWPGLWEQSYPTAPELSPYLRHGINNSCGEAPAVWRALAWALTEGTERHAIPCYYRDEAANLLGVDRATIRTVGWEYEVDVERADWPAADRGFVPARACVPLRPAPDRWQRDHRERAGLFPLDTFAQLTALELAVGGDAASELTLFGLGGPAGRRSPGLADVLDRPDRPELRHLLRPGDVFVDLAVVRDYPMGWTNYLTVKTLGPTDRVWDLADHYSAAFRRYLAALPRIRTFEDFHAAIDELLAAPTGGDQR